jgi:hypothetical protein
VARSRMIVRPYQSIDGSQPSPWACVRMRKPGGALTDMGNEWGLLDTGSNWTYVPATWKQDLTLEDEPSQPVMLANDTKATMPACLVALELEGYALPSPLRVLVTPLPRLLVGRDVLDRFVVRFDGPGQRFRLIAPGTLGARVSVSSCPPIAASLTRT